MEKIKKKKRKTYTRRDFLKGFGSGALSTAVVPKLLVQDASSLQTKGGKVPLYSKKQITLTINEKKYVLVVEPRETLLHVLRERLKLTGTKESCNAGECGACTVIMDGRAVYSCMILAVEAEGSRITTVEGLLDGEELHPIQKAFVDNDAMQCGYCTPGQIMSAKALLDKNPNPIAEEVKRAMAGNLCRCVSYPHILNAVMDASKRLKKGGV
jgi:aerobic-type carbon monoxide dehydrogenase small subunit (CoxS/CutS family)